jgi:hypothetical protein
MNDFIRNHEPTPEFRASLEREIARVFRRESQFAPPRRRLRGGQVLAAGIALAVGLLLGAGTLVAAAQVQDARQRDELTGTMATKRLLAIVRLEMARLNYAQVRAGFEAGGLTRESLITAETDVRAMEVAVARIDLDIEEVRASAAPPRDELWAPLVAGRDFVKERLMLDASIAQQRSTIQERAVADLERAARAGVVLPAAMNAQSDLQAAKGEMEMAAQKLALRQEFVAGRVPAAEVERRLQRFELVNAIERILGEQRLAAQRLNVRGRAIPPLGAAGELEAKKAELQSLERVFQLTQLRKQLLLFDMRAATNAK